LVAAAFALTHSASAAGLTTLFSFCSQPSCTDGEAPHAGLIADGSGNLYGTTAIGGAFFSSGTVFELVANGVATVLHSFDAFAGDGIYPFAGLVMDHSQNLYGTTTEGGSGSFGTLFKLAPGGEETILYNFCSLPGCADGGSPNGVVIDGSGNLYGTTSGAAGGPGTVYELARGGSHRILHSFCSQRGCADGEFPYAAPIVDKGGNIYGTTGSGGAFGRGTVWQLSKDNNLEKWSFRVLYSFGARVADGNAPQGSLVIDGSGTLYGTTPGGGTHNQNGTVFELKPRQNGAHWTETILYNFCAETLCHDGSDPVAGLALDHAGRLYGTTFEGGTHGGGAVFELTPLGTGKWRFGLLYSFCSRAACSDGAQPLASLLIDAARNLYGTTSAQGAFGGGTVFELTR
jgi:uncharacterized repeat protein (TIGR03803 family)